MRAKQTEELREVISYGRWSDPKQSAGDSEKRQDKYYAAFMASGNYRPADLPRSRFLDKGKSGFRGNKQKDLDEFLKVLRSKNSPIKPDMILFVEAIDRLSRKGIRDTQKVVNEILDAGVDIAIAIPLEKIYRAKNTNDLGDSIELAAFAFAAHTYSKLLSKRVADFHQEAKKDAREKKRPICSGACPFWLDRIGTKKDARFEFKEGAKEIIQFIYQKTIEGLGGKRLCRELNERWPSFGKQDGWSDRYLRHIVRGDRRAIGECQPRKVDDETGKLIPDGDPIPGYYPAAVTEKIWMEAQTAIDNRSKEKGPSTEYVNLFTGLVRHAIDDCSMQSATYFQMRADGRKVIIRRLTSYNHIRRMKGASSESVQLDDFEYAVLTLLRDLDLSVFDGSPSVALEIRSVEAALERKQKRVTEIQSDVSTAVSMLLPQLNKLQSEIEGLKKQLMTLKQAECQKPAANLDTFNFLASLEQTPDNRQRLREAIKRLVKRITVLPVKLGDKKNSPIATHIEIELQNGLVRTTSQVGRNRIHQWHNFAEDKCFPKRLATKQDAHKMREIIKQVYSYPHFPFYRAEENLLCGG